MVRDLAGKAAAMASGGTLHEAASLLHGGQAALSATMILRLIVRLAVVLLALALSVPRQAMAQDLSGLARIDPARSVVDGAEGGDLVLRLGLTQMVPWRVRVRDAPPRLVIDFREVDFTGLDRVARPAPGIGEVRGGPLQPGWSRLVVELARPMTISRAVMATGGPVTVEVTMTPADPVTFATMAARPDPEEWAETPATTLPPPPVRGEGPVTVVLDPGHGGIDPGAEAEGLTEAHLMLTFARELKEALLRDGAFRVVMTREEDVFVPLETRTSIAREADADIFVSLHADALAEGEATGATIYTLAETATDAAAQALAERHDRDDLLAGVDLTGTDDLLATVLMDMARTETTPRTGRLAAALESAIRGAGLRMHRRPIQQAGFSVLKSPDIPSVLIEVGFMSSARDLERLRDSDWRQGMAAAIAQGLRAWADEDAALTAARD
jgi:N-acetylmuramoyl-L-alanine amidase